MRAIGIIINYFFTTPLNSYKRYLILRRAVKIGGFALENGTYFISPNYKSIEKKQVKRVSNGNKVLFFLNLVLRNKLTIKNNTNFEFISGSNVQLRNFSGDFLLVSNAGLKQLSRYNFKIFDSTNKLVFSFFTNHDEFNKYKDGAEFFGASYSIPKIELIDSSKNYVIEEKIDFEKSLNLELKRAAQIDIFKGYIKSLRDINYSTTTAPRITYKSNDSRVRDVIDKINNRIVKSEIGQLPVFLQHGDLSLSNVLVEKKTNIGFLIDWEHAGNYILFYDPFWNWINEALWNQDFTLLRLFLHGEFDRYIYDVLHVFKRTDLLPHKRELFLVVLVEILNKRLLSNDFSVNSDSMLLHKVSVLLNEIENANH